MPRRLATALFLLATALCAARPAYALFEDDEARKRVDRLRSEVAENQRRVEERLKAIDAAVSTASDRSVLIDMSAQLEALRNEMARMRGQLEVLSNQADTADRRQKDLYLDIDTRLRKLEQGREQAALTPQKPAAVVAPGGGGASLDAEVTPAETKAYQAALDQFKLGNYSLAVSAMQGFL